MQSLISELATIVGAQLTDPTMLVAAGIALITVATGAAARIVVWVEDLVDSPPCQNQQ